MENLFISKQILTDSLFDILGPGFFLPNILGTIVMGIFTGELSDIIKANYEVREHEKLVIIDSTT